MSAVRRLAMASVAVLAVTLPASGSWTTSGSHPTQSAGDQADKGLFASQLTAAGIPTSLPARGDGAADSTAANPAAAGLPDAASQTSGPGAIPATALAAYRRAAATLAISAPSCHLTWPLLAGIGKVETDHGRSWGSASRITATGEVVPTILGPILNGRNGTATLLDTDGGAYDNDRHYDRAVGPMQFVPQTWKELGRDGNGDGNADPNNIWDAALAAGDYLCGGGRNLADPADRRAAILAYNPSSLYVRAVLAWASAYQKAGAKLPALDGVPDPLVLGAGGNLGDNPFGDAFSYDESQGSGGGSPAGQDGGSGAIPPTSLINTQRPLVGWPRSTPPQPATNQGYGRYPTTPGPPPAHLPPPKPKPPAPTPKPPPPPPKPKPPVCLATGITLVSGEPVTATAVDADKNGTNDALHVVATVTVPKAGHYTVGVRLVDANGWRITSTLSALALGTGKQTIAADLPGGDIGDAGASGPAALRITSRFVGADLSCARPLATGVSAGTLAASTFDGWITTLARLSGRLNADISAGQVTGDAATQLPAALQSPDSQNPDLDAFRSRLSAVTVVSPPEKARLDSLAQRLIAQAAAGVGATGEPVPYTDQSGTADGVG